MSGRNCVCGHPTNLHNPRGQCGHTGIITKGKDQWIGACECIALQPMPLEYYTIAGKAGSIGVKPPPKDAEPAPKKRCENLDCLMARFERDQLQSKLDEATKRITMLLRERGPGIQTPAEPVTVDLSGDYE